MTIRELLARASDELARHGVENSRRDAELLLAKALGVSRTALYAGDRTLAADEIAAAQELVARRARREPLAYVLGEWGFRRLVLKTDARGLVPRPETEMLVERALALVRGLPEPRILDVGTGTGAVALALADEHPGACVTALDASPAALALARENVERAGLGDRVRLVEGDLFAGLPPGPFDLVVSNPPYVREEELAGLEPEVRDWEPRAALVDRGALEALARAARSSLAGWLVLEVGDGRAGDVSALLRTLRYGDVTVSPDLAGRERVVEGRWA